MQKTVYFISLMILINQVASRSIKKDNVSTSSLLLSKEQFMEKLLEQITEEDVLNKPIKGAERQKRPSKQHQKRPRNLKQIDEEIIKEYGLNFYGSLPIF